MNKLYDQVEELLGEHHEAEIGRLLGIPDKDAKLMVRGLRSHLNDWRPEQVSVTCGPSSARVTALST